MTSTNFVIPVLGIIRPPFLVLTPVCVLLGLGTAIWSSGSVSTGLFILVLIGALCAHVSVNSFNEYLYLRSGLDLSTKRTPFSGGSGVLPAHPEMAAFAVGIAVVSLAITTVIGAYLVLIRGIDLLPLGILGLLIIYFYTNQINRNPVLCLIAPGLGFGPLMVLGTHFVLSGAYSWTAFIASLIPFFLVSDLLLLNQFPDVDADKAVGRQNFPIALGRRASSYIYGAFLLFAYLTIALGVYVELLPTMAMLGLITAVIAIPVFVGVRRYADDIEKLVPYMGLNVVINLLTPLLLFASLLFG